MKQRVTNAGVTWVIQVERRTAGKAKLTITTEKHLVRFDLDWWDIRYLADELWGFVMKEQTQLDAVKTDLRGPQ